MTEVLDYRPQHALDPIVQEVIDEQRDYRFPIQSRHYAYLQRFVDEPTGFDKVSPRSRGKELAKTMIVLELDELAAVSGLMTTLRRRLIVPAECPSLEIE